MAGTNPDFDAAEFRAGIRLAMNMGLPSGGEAPVFHFPATRSTVGSQPADQTGVPFDPAIDVTETPTAAPATGVPCTIRYVDNQGQDARGFGVITPTRVEVTLLDEDHALVEGCERVVIDGDTYWYRRTETPQGLFEVTLYTLHFAADTEA